MATADCEKRDILEAQQGITDQPKMQAIGRAGHAVNLAVDRFMTIGEIIADDNPEIKLDMYSSCKRARDAGKSMERLCEISTINEIKYSELIVPLCDKNAIIVSAKTLLTSITRVLLLVDIVVVKQLLTAKKDASKSLRKLESVINFSEFVRAYSVFGIEMVELAYLTANQHINIKEERRRAQMHSARQILERSITILLTSSKTCLLHCDCMIAKENRDTVFCQIRRAMDLIHFVVKDSIFDTWLSFGDQIESYRNAEKGTVYSTLKHFKYLMERFRFKNKKNEQTVVKGIKNISNEDNWASENIENPHYSHSRSEYDQNVSFTNNLHYNQKNSTWQNSDVIAALNTEIIEESAYIFEKLLEKTQDFTDSAYTSHENRESILLLCDHSKIELNKCLNIIYRNGEFERTHLIDLEIDKVLNAVKHLSEQLVISVTDQMMDLYNSLRMSVELVNSFHSLAIKQDMGCLQERANRFNDYCDHIIDVCKLLQHIALTETLQVQVKCLAINIRIYGPQVIIATKVLSKYTSSVPVNENFEAFVEMWKWLISEITTVVKQILESTKEVIEPNILEKYKSIANSSMNCQPGQEEQEKCSYPELDTKNDNDNINPYNEKWNDELSENNDILKRAKNMSAMAFAMYQFTKGNGTLRTTQDLFTQAEYFAEEANRLYKVLRQFSYQVPASQNKKDLLNILDRVPTFVQTLQFTVKEHTVGKAATFVKVDHVIRETKSLMSVINKVVTKCFECANKYKLDFTGLSGGISSGSLHGDDSNTGGMGDSKGTTNSTEGSM